MEPGWLHYIVLHERQVEELASRAHVRELAQDELNDDQGGGSDPLFARGGGIVCHDLHSIREDWRLVLFPKSLQPDIIQLGNEF